MWFRPKSLEQHLNETKRIVIDGVFFKIKRVNTTDYLNGLDVMQKIHDIYQLKRSGKTPDAEIDAAANLKKIKEYCRNVILAGTVTPKLSAKPDGTGLYVDELFSDFHLAQKLTEAILRFTYKKK